MPLTEYYSTKLPEEVARFFYYRFHGKNARPSFENRKGNDSLRFSKEPFSHLSIWKDDGEWFFLSPNEEDIIFASDAVLFRIRYGE